MTFVIKNKANITITPSLYHHQVAVNYNFIKKTHYANAVKLFVT